MYCISKITDELVYIGGSDRRLPFFEGFYPVPKGISYNSYLLKGEKTVLFDTVDRAVEPLFFENLAHVLDGRTLDYVFVHHMEPDHSATLKTVLLKYPSAQVVCTPKAADMICQFTGLSVKERLVAAADGGTLCIGKHEFRFITAPMVHWPEVFVTYDTTDKILFSADAFGTFGALSGDIFADPASFDSEILPEARRYYCNIVGKYGPQVQTLLKKASALSIRMICPLHGPVYRGGFEELIEKYSRWAAYTPEEKGVVIAYASVYGDTANAAEIVAASLAEKGIKTAVFDVSVTHPSEIIAAAFRYSHLIFASTTYNNGIFVKMEDLLRDLAAHGLQNRTIALIQNGSWAPSSGKQMRAILETLKGTTVLEETLTLRSALCEAQTCEIRTFVNAVAGTF